MCVVECVNYCGGHMIVSEFIRSVLLMHSHTHTHTHTHSMIHPTKTCSNCEWIFATKMPLKRRNNGHLKPKCGNACNPPANHPLPLPLWMPQHRPQQQQQQAQTLLNQGPRRHSNSGVVIADATNRLLLILPPLPLPLLLLLSPQLLL